jgi:hypothetical protein
LRSSVDAPQNHKPNIRCPEEPGLNLGYFETVDFIWGFHFEFITSKEVIIRLKRVWFNVSVDTVRTLAAELLPEIMLDGSFFLNPYEYHGGMRGLNAELVIGIVSECNGGLRGPSTSTTQVLSLPKFALLVIFTLIRYPETLRSPEDTRPVRS